MKKSMAKSGALFALALVAVPVAAHAETALGKSSVVIEYRDLDLTHEAGQARLDRRIAAAISKVCGQASPRTLAQNDSINACRATALQSVQTGKRVAIARAGQERAFASNPSAIVGN